MNRIILHSDLNNFYASCECSRDISLRGKPVAVCGSQAERHGIVLAKNYEARAFGVSTGDAIWQAKQKCPDLITVDPHYSLYMKYSKLVRSIYEEYTDLVEPFGMDECWLDISGKKITIDDGMRLADEIRCRVKSEIGLTVSVGVSFNKVFAKLGSDMKKPDATTVITKENFKEKIYGLPASDLLGVGRATNHKLKSFGILTIGDIAQTDCSFFEKHMGKNGVRLWKFAAGLDNSAVLPAGTSCPAKSFGHGTTPNHDLSNSYEVWLLILSLTQDVSHSLISCDQKCGGVSVFIRDSDLVWIQFQTVFDEPTFDPYEISCAAYRLFSENYSWAKPVRAITVTAIRLVSNGVPVPYGLFRDNEKIERQEKLCVCIDSLRNRFGNTAILPAALLKSAEIAKTDEVKIRMPRGLQTM